MKFKILHAMQHAGGGWGSGFIPIAEYGAEFQKGSWKGKPRKAVRLLYSGKNHYDLLVWGFRSRLHHGGGKPALIIAKESDAILYC